MSHVYTAGKRLAVIFFSWLSVLQSPLFVRGVQTWTQTWVNNRRHIIMLTVINATITAGTELASRSITSPFLGHKKKDYGFFVKASSGKNSINRQSLINIWMTIFASLIGGPVYFFKRRKHRFYYFVAFGTCNSLLAQTISGLFIDGLMTIAITRLLFDFVYNGTLKFFMFEWLRKPILTYKEKALRVGAYRVKQDFITTFIRVNLLNLLGFRG